MKLLTLLILSTWSNLAVASTEGKFTFLGLNQCAPFEGTLFDPTATATILTEVQTAKKNCEITMAYELTKQKAEFDLELTNLQIRYDALEQKYTTTIQSLETENNALAEALRKQSKKNPALWVALGVAGGIAISYTAHEVFNE